MLKKLLKLKTYRAEFTYEKEIFDRDLTKLAFLNTVRREFDEQVQLFGEQLEKEIETETGSGRAV